MGTTKTSRDVERAFMKQAKARTGRTVAEWLQVLQALGSHDRQEILNVLKSLYALNHLQAQLIAGMYLNGGKQVYEEF